MVFDHLIKSIILPIFISSHIHASRCFLIFRGHWGLLRHFRGGGKYSCLQQITKKKKKFQIKYFIWIPLLLLSFFHHSLNYFFVFLVCSQVAVFLHHENQLMVLKVQTKYYKHVQWHQWQQSAYTCIYDFQITNVHVSFMYHLSSI